MDFSLTGHEVSVLLSFVDQLIQFKMRRRLLLLAFIDKGGNCSTSCRRPLKTGKRHGTSQNLAVTYLGSYGADGRSFSDWDLVLS